MACCKGQGSMALDKRLIADPLSIGSHQKGSPTELGSSEIPLPFAPSLFHFLSKAERPHIGPHLFDGRLLIKTQEGVVSCVSFTAFLSFYAWWKGCSSHELT